MIHNKAAIKKLKNYRPISQLSVVYKLFVKVIVNRGSNRLDFQQPKEHAGFTTGYSTIGHIYAINKVIEKSAV